MTHEYYSLSLQMAFFFNYISQPWALNDINVYLTNIHIMALSKKEKFWYLTDQL